MAHSGIASAPIHVHCSGDKLRVRGRAETGSPKQTAFWVRLVNSRQARAAGSVTKPATNT
jgi:hypothetical protein